MIPVEMKQECLRNQENGIDQRKRREGMIHRTKNQTDHAGRGDIIERQERGFPCRMGFETIRPSRRDQEEDGKDEISPGEPCVESFEVSLER